MCFLFGRLLFYGRDDGQRPSSQKHGMARWLREGGGNDANWEQAAPQQTKHPRSFGQLPSACSMAEAEFIPPQRRLPLSVRLSNFVLGFFFCYHCTPLTRTKIYIPPPFVFLVCGFLTSPFCSACVKTGVTFLHPGSGYLFVQVPWGAGLHGEGSWSM